MKNEHARLQHRPFLTPIWITALGAFVAFCCVVVLVWVWATANATTVIVIRHAENDSGGAPDPALSTAGAARAALLAQMLGGTAAVGRLDAIYISSALRSKQTAAPLAARLGLSPVIAPADDSHGLVRRALREHGGGRVLIVAGADTVPQIAAVLTGRSEVPKLDDADFGTMYVVTVPRIGHANLLRISY